MRWRNSRSGAPNGSTSTLSLFLLFLFSTQSIAQSLSGLPALKSLTSAGGPSSTSGSDSSSQTSAASTSNSDKATTSASDSSSATSSASGTTVTSVDISLTNGISMSSSSTPTSSSSGSIFHLSGLPTVAGATDPTPTVPNTANAPFMQKSSLPEGSVFIIVGAILGFFGGCVLLWRGLVAWSLSRSVKRAAMTQHQAYDLKSSAFGTPPTGIYSQKQGSTGSMEALTALTGANKSKRGSQKPPSSQGASPVNPLANRASNQNLFFSPTAGAGHHSQAPPPHLAAANRSSTYLPAGYYASGSSQPAGGAPTAQINAHAQRGSSILNPLSDRLSGLRAETAGYQRAQSLGPSPPASPGLAPTRSPGNASSTVGQTGAGGLYSQPSYSSLALSVPGGAAQPGGRTPSAYLEDLFENHGNGPRERF